jgi:ATP-dependent DNA ligase
MSPEGIVSKRADVPYTPGNRGLWHKVNADSVHVEQRNSRIHDVMM